MRVTAELWVDGVGFDGFLGGGEGGLNGVGKGPYAAGVPPQMMVGLSGGFRAPIGRPGDGLVFMIYLSP